jgi:Phospholipase_D-nuclease N-terminal
MFDVTGILFTVLGLAWLAVVLFALRDISTRTHLSDIGRLGWIAVVVFAPLLGTIAWFVTRPKRPSVAGHQ